MTSRSFDYSFLIIDAVEEIPMIWSTTGLAHCVCGHRVTAVSSSKESTTKLLRRKFREHIRSRTKGHQEWLNTVGTPTSGT